MILNLLNHFPLRSHRWLQGEPESASQHNALPTAGPGLVYSLMLAEHLAAEASIAVFDTQANSIIDCVYHFMDNFNHAHDRKTARMDR